MRSAPKAILTKTASVQPKWYRLLAVIMLAIILATGCATTPYDQALESLKTGQYETAIQALEELLVAYPDSVPILRQTGLAHYKKKDYPTAIGYFNRTLELNPDDGWTILHLGLIYEMQGDEDAVIHTYRNYLQAARKSRLRKKIEIRLSALIDRRMTRLAKLALTEEALGRYPEIEPNTVAVMYFDNSTADITFAPLRKGLANLLISDLSKVNSLKLVERTRMQKLLQEMGLADSNLVASNTASRTGRLLGASQVVKGGFTVLRDRNLRLNAIFGQTVTSEIQQTEALRGPLTELFEMEKALVFSLIEKMKVSISPEEEAAIQKRPAPKFLAFLSYSQGLDLMDRGNYAAADAAFSRAIEIDPEFNPAQQSLEEVQVINQTLEMTATAPEDVQVAIETIAEAELPTMENLAIPLEVEAGPDILAELGGQVSRDFISQPEQATSLENETQVRSGGSGSDETSSPLSMGQKVVVEITWEP